jgi:hypothetical protein
MHAPPGSGIGTREAGQPQNTPRRDIRSLHSPAAAAAREPLEKPRRRVHPKMKKEQKKKFFHAPKAEEIELICANILVGP